MLNFSNMQKTLYALLKKYEVLSAVESSYKQIEYLFLTYKPQSNYKNQYEIEKAL